MNLFGLIGYPLTHSFSKRYFTEKFEREAIADSRYELFEIKEAKEVLEVINKNPNLKGLNVTIPHKETVMSFLDSIDEKAKAIGAVNVIKIENNKRIGYNSDYYGFLESLKRFIGDRKIEKALVLGTGGSSKAVCAALKELKIIHQYVSRSKDGPHNSILYADLNEAILHDHLLIINATPRGMYPKVDDAPEIPYAFLGSEHFLVDLVYNPEETTFMKRGAEMGAQTKNGLEMLHLQAEKAWEIWNS